MSSIFTGVVTGNVGKDAELKFLGDGKAVLNFSVATSKRAKKGEEITTWVNVALWGKQAESLAPYVKKGTLLTAVGEVSNRPYEKDGVTKYSLELSANAVQLLGGRKAANEDAETVAPVKSSYEANDSAPF